MIECLQLAKTALPINLQYTCIMEITDTETNTLTNTGADTQTDIGTNTRLQG